MDLPANRSASCRAKRRSERGSETVEAAIVLPLLLYMLMGLFDIGFYVYSYISVENAARVAAVDTAASSSSAANSTLACADVSADLKSLINAGSFSPSCNSSPLTVSSQLVFGPDGNPASLVTVRYQLQLPTGPWLPQSIDISRQVEMRLRS